MAPLATDLERPKPPGAAPDPESFLAKPGALVELGLTFPLFLLYHLGVVFLGIQNATDFLTHGLMVAAEGNTGRYLGITAAIGVIFVGVFVLLGRGQRFAPVKFGQVAVEGAVYALVMRVGAAYVVGRLFAGGIQEQGRFTGFIMSLGAGFYEEIAFRVVLFGLGAKLLVWFWTGKRMKLVGSSDFSFSPRIIGLMLLWAVVSACVFSGVHYVGALGDPFSLKSFLFRALLGLALTLIYATRGFATAVWTHALYDVWVLVIAGK